MRKISFFLSAFLCVIFVFSGCDGCASCSSSRPDYYDNYLTGTAIENYSETLTYAVSYDDNYTDFDGDYFKKSSDLDANIDISGTFTTKTTAISVATTVNELSALGITANLVNGYNEFILKQTSLLSLTVKYEFREKTGANALVFNDTVVSTSYFYPSSQYFAPIYSAKSYDTSNITLLSNTKADKVKRYVYDTNVFYDSLGNATITIKDKSASASVLNYPAEYYRLAPVTSKTEQVEEDFGYFIDNENLLFVTRNLKAENSPLLNVLNTSYLGIEPVFVNRETTSTYTDKIVTVNGTTLPVGISSDVVRVGRSDTTNSGTAMVLYYQNASVNVGAKAYNQRALLKMVTKLPSYSGAVVYSLTNATVSI